MQKAMQERWLGSILAVILKMKPVNLGSSGSTRRSSAWVGFGDGALALRHKLGWRREAHGLVESHVVVRLISQYYDLGPNERAMLRAFIRQECQEREELYKEQSS